ncbi:hypothetical protein PZN02_004172 [Sinorhizobium garamanticum]|uniref:Uncharacterized protein n=1 Tax=Sinorhizobium garamanticum TaxID=680247 RepID=A0ABY8DLN7_9HYPH|nr:hypothetical protein [Sinorhizobium garamanticum]WEX90617.1 hypothetical protein PZN02_004172 [Sinorhizobium garamanticum]
MTGLEISHVSYSHGSRKTLDNASFQEVDAENRHFPLYCRRRHLP